MSRTALLDAHLTFWVVAALLCPPARPPMARAPAGSPRRRGRGRGRRARRTGRRGPDLLAAVAAVAVRVRRRPRRRDLGEVVGREHGGGRAPADPLWETSRRHLEAAAGAARWAAPSRARASASLLALLLVPAVDLRRSRGCRGSTTSTGTSRSGRTPRRRPTGSTSRAGSRSSRSDPDTGEMTPTHPVLRAPARLARDRAPTSFYFEDDGPQMEQVLGIGNPAVFWASLLAMPYLLVRVAADARLARRLHRRSRSWWSSARGCASAAPPSSSTCSRSSRRWSSRSRTCCAQLSDATLVVRERDGAVAIDPETGRARRLDRVRVPAVRVDLPHRGGRDVRVVLAGPDRRSHLGPSMAHDRVVPGVDLDLGFAPDAVDRARRHRRPRRHPPRGHPVRARGRRSVARPPRGAPLPQGRRHAVVPARVRPVRRGRLRGVPGRRARHRLERGDRHRRVPGERAHRPGGRDRLARHAPWSTGKVGMFGTSYSGFNSLQVAMERPPGARRDRLDLRERRPVPATTSTTTAAR